MVSSISRAIRLSVCPYFLGPVWNLELVLETFLHLNIFLAFFKSRQERTKGKLNIFALLLFAELYEQAIKYEKGSFITSTGALATLSGAKTGRSPRDKRVVRDETTEDDLWWGK